MMMLVSGASADDTHVGVDEAAYRKIQDESVRLIDTDDYAAATPLARKSLSLAKRLFGDAHFETADCLYNLGTIERLTGKWKKCVVTLEKAAAIYEKLGTGKLEDHARTLADVANVLVAHDDFARAKPIAARAVAEYRAIDEQNDDYGYALADLARCDYEEHRWVEATEGYEEAAMILGDAVHAQLFDAKTLWGLALLQDDNEHARKLLDEALVLSAKLPSPYRFTALLNVAACAVLGGRPKDGEKPAQLALDIARKTDSKPDLAMALFRRGDVHVCLEQHARAVPLLEQAVKLVNVLKDESMTIEYTRLLGVALNGAELYDRASRCLLRVHAAAKKRASEDPEHFDDLEFTLIDSLYEDEQYERAKAYSAVRLARLERESPESVDHVKAIEQHALILDELGEKDEARPLYVRVVELREKTGAEKDNIAIAWQNLAMHASSREPPDWAAADDAYMHVLALTPDALDEIVEDLDEDLERCPRVASLDRARTGQTPPHDPH
jgi:tetratricopeptide (TPR) repeat protein